MRDKFEKILSKKRSISGPEKDAKMDVIKHLRNEASDAMKDHMGHFQKATVMSNSKEGLKKGLKKAEEVVSSPEFEKMREDAENPYSDAEHAHEEHRMNEGGEVETSEEESMESPEHESSESPEQEEEEGNEFEGLDMEDIHRKLQKLMELKQKMESK